MPTFKKMKNYRRTDKKTGVDIIPLEDREVSSSIYSQYVEVEKEEASGKNIDRD